MNEQPIVGVLIIVFWSSLESPVIFVSFPDVSGYRANLIFFPL